VDTKQIGVRWMDAWMDEQGQREKKLSKFTVGFLERVLCGYWKLELGSRGENATGRSCAETLPPFIHQAQVRQDSADVVQALTTSRELVKMWQDCQEPEVRQHILLSVRGEMDGLIREYPRLDSIRLLVSFQSFLVYILMVHLSPPLGAPSSLVSGDTVLQLQEFASHVSSAGLFSQAELQHKRPKWESWIIAEAKRRTIYVTYLFNNLYQAQHGMPIFLAEELSGMLLPATKKLWEAQKREEWEREYEKHLEKWPNGYLKISELWSMEGIPEEEKQWRKKKVEMWLEDVDDFGMMLFATCAHIHGC
ncbi:uncharacterized protein BDR25DRAFT_210044, partial [Lindgomyces ingoldianus]